MQLGHIRSRAELEDLWEIDSAAYGEASITYEKFQDWWFFYPSDLHACSFVPVSWGLSALGPLSTRSAELFTTGRLKESQLNGRAMRPFINASTRFSYISRIVLRSELRGGRAIKILLSRGIGCWPATAHIHFPCQLLALAYSEQVQALLDEFDSFIRPKYRCQGFGSAAIKLSGSRSLTAIREKKCARQNPTRIQARPGDTRGRLLILRLIEPRVPGFASAAFDQV